MENNNKIKNYMDKIKASASSLVSERRDGEDDTTVELDRRNYELLKHSAEQQGTTVNALVDRVVKQYLTAQTASSLSGAVPVERKENNPLLYLDGLTKNMERN